MHVNNFFPVDFQLYYWSSDIYSKFSFTVIPCFQCMKQSNFFYDIPVALLKFWWYLTHNSFSGLKRVCFIKNQFSSFKVWWYSAYLVEPFFCIFSPDPSYIWDSGQLWSYELAPPWGTWWDHVTACVTLCLSEGASIWLHIGKPGNPPQISYIQ